MAVVFAPGAWDRGSSSGSENQSRAVTAAVLAPTTDFETTVAAGRTRDVDTAVALVAVLAAAMALAIARAGRTVAPTVPVPAGPTPALLFSRRGPPHLAA